MPANSMAATTAAIKNRIRGFRFTTRPHQPSFRFNDKTMERRASPPVHHSSLQRKPIQERKIAGDKRKPPHNQQNPQRDQQASARDLHGMHVEFEPIVKL